MRSRCAAAVLSFIVLAASCAPSTGPSEGGGGAGGYAEPVETKDQGDPAEEASAGDPVLLTKCLVLAGAPMAAKEEFCRSLVDRGAAARCWKNRWTRVTWTGWCYFEFGD